MGIGLHLGSISEEIGTASFFHAFFSTITGNLEPNGWGSRFPILMNELYQGQLERRDAAGALKELEQIRTEFARLATDKVIWDIEDRSKRPPWGDNIADTVTSLENYFVASAGRDLIEMLREILQELGAHGGALTVY
jgi:2,3-bisphosphoglycerate-dependent phosphoglycerate mutase